MEAAFKELALQPGGLAYGYVRVTEVLFLHPAQMTGKKMSTIDEEYLLLGMEYIKRTTFIPISLWI